MSKITRAIELWDFEAWAEEYYPERIDTGTSNLIRVKCEKCADHKFRLYLNFDKKVWWCHNCGYGINQDIVDFIAFHEQKSRVHVISDLLRLLRPSDEELQRTVENLNREYYDEDEPEIEYKPFSLPEFVHRIYTKIEVKGPVGKQVKALESAAKKYLNDRGISKKLIYRSHIYVCYAGRYRNRLIFPAYMRGQVVSWVARRLYVHDKGQKYLNPSGVDQGTILWGFDNARVFDEVVVCEGVFDALKVGDRAVAAFGKNVTKNHLNLIEKYWDKAVLLLDPDAHAMTVDRNGRPYRGDRKRSKVYRLATEMTIPVRVAMLPFGTDAGDSDRKHLASVLEKAPLLHSDSEFKQEVVGLLSAL